MRESKGRDPNYGGMPADDLVLRSARNAFLALLLVLVAISIYQFITVGSVTPAIAVVWVTGAGVFYVSKWYYGRDGGAEAAAETAEGDPN